MELIGLIKISILQYSSFCHLQLLGLLLLLFEFLFLFFFFRIFLFELFHIFLELLIFQLTCWCEVLIVDIVTIIEYISILFKCLAIFYCICLLFYLLLNQFFNSYFIFVSTCTTWFRFKLAKSLSLYFVLIYLFILLMSSFRGTDLGFCQFLFYYMKSLYFFKSCIYCTSSLLLFLWHARSCF